MFEPDIVCPSGLTGRVRGLAGQEYKVFANKEVVAGSRIFDRVMTSCWVDTFSVPDLYKKNGALRQDGTLDWGRVLTCDRFYALSQGYTAGDPLGGSYSATRQCVNSRCRHVFKVEVDPYTDFETLDIDPAVMKALEEASPLEQDIGNDRMFYQLITGDAVPRRKQPAAEVGLSRLAARIAKVERSDGRTIQGAGVVTWLRRLSVRDWQDVLDAVDDIEGGLDTTVEITCPECFQRWDQYVPYPNRMYDPRVARAIISAEGETVDPGVIYTLRLPSFQQVFSMMSDFSFRRVGMNESVYWDLSPEYVDRMTFGTMRMWRHRMDEVRQDLNMRKGGA